MSGDQKETDRGAAGELQQKRGADEATLTTSQGVPLGDNQNTLRAGTRGPALLQDFAMRDKIFRFDHERIPERVVHARGYGAHGTFTVTDDLSDVTCAQLFSEVGNTVPAFVRFSTVAGSKGSFDLARDVRGFAVKLYTQEGNWDLVGNNIPVFFIQDAMKFPDLVHSVKEEPDRGFPQAQSAHENFWDFVAHMPEATHMTLWQMSDRAIPRSFRFMEGFGVHTFRFVTDDGQSTYVKFHWRPKLGCQSVLWDEAVKINGADPDFHRRDLWDAITGGNPPEWDLAVQLFDQETADGLPFDPLDPTKLITEEDVPLRVVGKLTLDRVVDNDFAETEQVAFCTQNVVRGIDFTADPLLQGRNFSYLDTQLSRLGSPNFTQLPVNAPRCPMANFARDGHMQFDIPRGPANYEPNGHPTGERGPRVPESGGYNSFPEPPDGAATRLRPESFADHFSQARVYWISQSPIEQQHIIDAYVFELSKAERIATRAGVVANLRNVDERLATEVADGLGLSLPDASPAQVPVRDDLPGSQELSILLRPPNTFEGRKLGIIVTEGSDAALVDGLCDAVQAAGGMTELVAPKMQVDVGGDAKDIDKLLRSAPSVLFDAVAVIPGPGGGDDLAADPAAQQFVNDAYYHQKFIAFGGDYQPLLQAVNLADRLDSGCAELTGTDGIADFIGMLSELRHWDRFGDDA